MKLFSLLITTILFLAIGVAPASAAGDSKGSSTIKKCKDAQGRWHFGDRAADECERSKVIEMSTQGTKRGEIAAPPTAAELKAQDARAQQAEQEQQKALEQQRRDDVLLSSYGVEQDIIYVRDRKLAQVENAIKTSEGTLAPLRAVLKRMEDQLADETKRGDKAAIAQTTKSVQQTKAQIARHEETIAAKRVEQATIRKQYDQELARYRELKGKAPAKP